jgi:hypothetical protein
MESLEDYVKKDYMHIHEEWVRKNTPHYYETGVLYYPITNGFGTQTGGNPNKHLRIEHATYIKGGKRFIHLIEMNPPKGQTPSAYGSEDETIYKQLKRVDESILPVGNVIPHDNSRIFFTYNGIDYSIYQAYWRNYGDERLGGRITIRKVGININGVKFPMPKELSEEYFELYSVIGKSEWNLKHVKSADKLGREDYDIKFKVSVREFKKFVFQNPNVKFITDYPLEKDLY